MPSAITSPASSVGCSSPPPDSSLPAGRYKILDEIGRGALGVVHRALDTENGETVAVKFLFDEARDGSLLDRLLTEIEDARKAGDTVGGVVEVVVDGLPPGLGSHVHWDRRLDGRQVP